MELKEIICSSEAGSKPVQKLLDAGTFVGIDFGTSTTTVTRISCEDGVVAPVVLPVPQEDLQGVLTWDHLVPTVVAMKPDGHLLFGAGAKESALIDSQHYSEGFNVWSFCKMRLGEHACYPDSCMTRMKTPDPAKIIETPKDVAHYFFAYLKDAVAKAVEKEHLPKPVHYAITVPASFAPNQREELCQAIRDAGIEVDPTAILDEPNAAFLGAAAEHLVDGGADLFFRGDEPSRILVFDFGAGTCDISLLSVKPNLEMTNLAISHFTALGGRDIDNKIATEKLYPQLIEDRTGDDIPVMSVRQHLIDRLMPVAERMKIAICSKFDDEYGARAYDLVQENPDFHLEESFMQATQRFGIFEKNLRLTAGEFAEIMRGFSEPPEQAFDNGNKSIFEPIENVLNKVGYKKDDIDFVLLVGGSCLNPFVRQLIEEYFPGTVQVVQVRDPRILVAEGASIHALAHYGLSTDLILPITSEDIFANTRDGDVLVFAAGTSVPANWKEIAGLYIDDEDARSGSFGIPFRCQSGAKIGVAKFDLPGLESGCEVKLVCSLLGDKVLAYRIVAEGREFSGVLQMPLRSEVVDERQEAYVKAVNDVNFSALCHRGTPTPESYVAAAKACHKVKRYEEEAAYYRQLMYAYRQLHYEFEAAEAFRKALKRREALAWSRKAFAHRVDYLNLWYLIWDIAAVNGWDDHELGALLERALASYPDDLDFKYVDMLCLDGCGDKEEAQKRAAELCEAWEREGVENIGRYSLVRFEEVARRCGKRSLCVDIRKQRGKMGDPDDADTRKGESVTRVRAHIPGANNGEAQS